MWKTALALAALLMVATAAGAGGRSLLAPPGAKVVIVWKDSKALFEGLELIRAGVHETRMDLLLRLISCVVASGNRVIISDAGVFTSEIVVIDGDNAGCRGIVSNDELGPE